MHLCIFANNVTTKVSGITLTDGCIPSVGGHHFYGENACEGFYLEPTVWFKTLVVDVVSVDCSRRQLSWEISSFDDGHGDSPVAHDDEGTKIMDIPMSISADETLDLDEVFDSLPVLISNYQNNFFTTAQFHDGIMKLLHLYILPTIYLSNGHIERMRDCLEKQEKFLQRINDDIERISRKLEAVTQSKKKLRQRIVSEFLASNSELPLPGSLVHTLADDISDDIRQISETLEVAQDGVNRAKMSLSTTTQLDLDMARKNRDEVVQSYEQMLTARENILVTKKSLENSRKGRRSQTINQPEHRIYQELTLLQENFISAMRLLSEKKLMATSVRETIKLTIQKLETGVESCGGDVDSGDFVKASDVLDQCVQPASKSWMTLAEQVAEILTKPNHPMAKTHIDFCNCVIERCRTAVREKMIYEVTFGRLSVSDDPTCVSPHSDLQDSDCSFRNTSPTDVQSLLDASEYCRVVIPCEVDKCQSDPESKSRGSSPVSSDPGGRKPDGVLRRKGRQHQKTFPWKGSSQPELLGTDLSTMTLCMLNSSSDDAVLVFHEDNNYTRRAITSLKQDITTNFETITELLRAELKQKSKTTIWQSYEYHFYDRTMEHILTLYELEYCSVTRMLGEAVRSLQAAHLSFEDSILANMLEEEPTPHSTTPHSTTPSQVLHEKSNGVRTFSGTNTACDPQGVKPDVDSDLEILPFDANPNVDNVEEYLPRLRKISENELDMEGHLGFTNSSASSRQHSDAVRPGSSQSFSSRRTVRKSIKVAHPFSTVIVYDRTICPSLDSSSIQNESNDANRASGNSSTALASAPISTTNKEREQEKRRPRTMTMKPEYRRNFQHALDYLSAAMETRCLSAKFQQLRKCLQEISRQIACMCGAACGDQLLDGVIMLLCNLDESLLSQLYVQVMMLTDLIPPFFCCSSFNFTVVQFFVAFQFLKDQILLKRPLLKSQINQPSSFSSSFSSSSSSSSYFSPKKA